MAESKASEYLRTFSLDPKSGKTRFKLRTLNNFILAVVVFLPLALIYALLWSQRMALAWLADFVTIAILFFIYRMFWNKRPIRVRCPRCRKKIGSNTPWVCGACEGKNENPDDFSFLNRCQSCGIEPPSYQCHHEFDDGTPCGKLISLTDDESLRNYAYCLNPSYKTEEGKGDPAVYEREKRWREFKISLTRLDTEMKEAEQEYERMAEKKKPLAAMTAEERVDASCEKHMAQTIAARIKLSKKKKEIEEIFKDDPIELEKALEALQDWYDSGIWERSP